MTAREILEKLYEEGNFEGEHRDIHPDRIYPALTDLKTLLLDRGPKEGKILDLNADCSSIDAYLRHKERTIGHNKAVKAFREVIEEIFK